MKYLTMLGIAAGLLFASCEKSNESDRVVVDMEITAVNIPATVTKGSEITGTLTCQAPNLCYLFSHLEVKESTANTYEIRAKALYPNPLLGAVACGQAIYSVDTTAKVLAPEAGLYTLKFYNGNDLFRSVTVDVQ